ncbi:hypothetical protein ACFSJM_08740 [Lactococcus formosensis subsp. bovis]|uniref:hypothetical protein n=1 Tax=Lactococcus formosensis TaxID=1281486 RepID=UPI001BD018CD|nr:hypothetical protein [Lactococcus formosensis]
MQFNKTLKALLRAKQEGQNDSYKAGFNDALALLDQEEQHIEFENQTNFSQEVPQHFHVVKDSDTNVERYQHQEEINLDEKFEKVAKEAINELATFKEERNNTFTSDYATSPKLKTVPEDFSLFDEDALGDVKEATHLSSEENLTQSISQTAGGYGKGVLVTPLGKELMKDQPLNEDKEIEGDISEEDEKDASKDKHNNIGVDEQLDVEEIKKQRQLAALASARRKAQEDDEDEDE